MLTRNCKKIIKAICSSGDEARYQRYTVQKIIELTNLSIDAVYSACEQLEAEGYMEIDYLPFSHRPIIDFVRLRELGVHHREVCLANVQHYVAVNWIAFLALVVAILSLIFSVISLSK